MTASVSELNEILDRAFAAWSGGRAAEAETLCLGVIAARADVFEAQHLLAVAQAAQGKVDLALASYARALALRPRDAEALFNRGNDLSGWRRFAEAVESYDTAVAARPDYADAWFNRGNALMALGRLADAAQSYDRAVAARPDFADASLNAGIAWRRQGQPERALAAFDRVLALKPDLPQPLLGSAMALRDLGRPVEALARYDRLIELNPNEANALSNRGNVLHDMRLYQAALESYEQALAVNPRQPFAFSGAAECALKLCDWERWRRYGAELPTRIADQTSIVAPFVVLGYSGDPALQRACAEKFLRLRLPARPAPLWAGQRWSNERIRVAYLSADFRDHPVSHLLAPVIERHDRGRFETFGVSFGGDDGSPIGRRMAAAFDTFHDIGALSDRAAAEWMASQRIDIAIDLMGFTQSARPGLLAHRPAPIQASYLGYPGTSGADFIDYILGDDDVLPAGADAHYTEACVRMAGSYWPGAPDAGGEVPSVTREAVGLPKTGFVFCCFNATWKITPAVFEVWMRLLAATPGSVLWLNGDNPAAEANLRREAQARKIDPARLVFKARSGWAEHMALHRLADLFLDTLPYNAHATAADALSAGLPLLTCRGEGFAGRVAASLLTALGMPDMIAETLAEYEAIGLRATRAPDLRRRLAQALDATSAFDPAAAAGRLEATFEAMWRRWQAVEPAGPINMRPLT